MQQQGASEIYLNGKLIKSFGSIGDSIGCIAIITEVSRWLLQGGSGHHYGGKRVSGAVLETELGSVRSARQDEAGQQGAVMHYFSPGDSGANCYSYQQENQPR